MNAESEHRGESINWSWVATVGGGLGTVVGMWVKVNRAGVGLEVNSRGGEGPQPSCLELEWFVGHHLRKYWPWKLGSSHSYMPPTLPYVPITWPPCLHAFRPRLFAACPLPLHLSRQITIEDHLILSSLVCSFAFTSFLSHHHIVCILCWGHWCLWHIHSGQTSPMSQSRHHYPV